MFPVFEYKYPERAPQLIPVFFTRAECASALLIYRICEIKDLMHKKRYLNEQKKVERRILFTVAKIMFRMISQIFKGIEIFVFNFPSGASSFDEYFDIGLINRNVGYPATMKDDLSIRNDGIFKKINVVSLFASV